MTLPPLSQDYRNYSRKPIWAGNVLNGDRSTGGRPEFTSREVTRVIGLLESAPQPYRAESGSGIAPTGYEYREYKNWRGIPKPRQCPFCKRAKGEIRKVRGGFQGEYVRIVTLAGRRKESQEEALRVLEWAEGSGRLRSDLQPKPVQFRPMYWSRWRAIALRIWSRKPV
jgi:hypothetical protein